MTRTVKLAVVGTGLAGLTTAYLLKRPLEGDSADVEFEVHVFEKVRFSYRLLAMLDRDKGPLDWYGLLVHFTSSSWLEGRLASRRTYAVISRRYSLHPRFLF
jgi:flavin-dependent dehydrogenase